MPIADALIMLCAVGLAGVVLWVACADGRDRRGFLLAVVLSSGCCSHEPLAAEALLSFRAYRDTVLVRVELSADAQRESGLLGDDIDAALVSLAGETATVTE